MPLVCCTTLLQPGRCVNNSLGGELRPNQLGPLKENSWKSSVWLLVCWAACRPGPFHPPVGQSSRLPCVGKSGHCNHSCPNQLVGFDLKFLKAAILMLLTSARGPPSLPSLAWCTLPRHPGTMKSSLSFDRRVTEGCMQLQPARAACPW
jgi:hypothetical protein